MNVLIVEPNHSYIQMFIDNGFTLVQTVEEADIVLFTGGSDVSPVLYDEEMHPYTRSSVERDELETSIYKECVDSDTPMVGICRGGQFLNVMNGGKMFQHVDGHAIGRLHELVTDRGWEIDVTSTHHQMMIPAEIGEVLATARESSYRENVVDGAVVRETQEHDDTEVVFYSKTQVLCFQPHPEFLGVKHPCQKYFFELLSVHLGVE